MQSANVLMLLAGAVSFAQTPAQPDPSELFEKAAHIINENARALPRFACTETVERSFYAVPDKLKNWNVRDASPADLPGLQAERQLVRSNRVRLEVGVFDDRQLFAWPGAREFKYEAFSDLAGGGAASSGEFGPFSVSVFLSDADPASFHFIGFQTAAGSKVAAYDYEVPVESSHFAVATGDGGTVVTGYWGVILIDVSTGDLRRLTVQITRPPSGSGVLSGRIVTDYAREKVGETVGLLPKSSLLHLLFSNDGSLAVNESNYGPCKLFSAESTLDFGLNSENTETAITADEEPGNGRIPSGRELIAKFVTPIDAKRTYAGDMIEVEVEKPLIVGGKTLIPARARITGRVVLIERRFHPTKEATVRIQFDRATFGGVSIPLLLGAAGPNVAIVRVPKRIDTASGVAKIATIMRVGSTDLHLDANTSWVWVTK